MNLFYILSFLFAYCNVFSCMLHENLYKNRFFVACEELYKFRSQFRYSNEHVRATLPFQLNIPEDSKDVMIALLNCVVGRMRCASNKMKISLARLQNSSEKSHSGVIKNIAEHHQLLIQEVMRVKKHCIAIKKADRNNSITERDFVSYVRWFCNYINWKKKCPTLILKGVEVRLDSYFSSIILAHDFWNKLYKDGLIDFVSSGSGPVYHPWNFEKIWKAPYTTFGPLFVQKDLSCNKISVEEDWAALVDYEDDLRLRCLCFTRVNAIKGGRGPFWRFPHEIEYLKEQLKTICELCLEKSLPSEKTA